MEKTIAALLKQNNSLIIPGFGSLIRSLATKNVTFNAFLKFNDGVLISQVAKEEGISKEDAEKKVEGFITGIKKTIDSGKPYELKGIGKFSKNEKGEIAFSGKLEGEVKGTPGQAKKTKTGTEAPGGKTAKSAASPGKQKQKEEEKASLNDKLKSGDGDKDLNAKFKKSNGGKEKATSQKQPEQSPGTQKQEKQGQQEKTPASKSKPKPSAPSSAGKQEQKVNPKPVTMSDKQHEQDNDQEYVKLSQEEIEARHKKRSLRGTIIFGILAIVVITLFNLINPHHEHGEEGEEKAKTEQQEKAAPAEADESGEPAEKEDDEEETDKPKKEANASSSASASTTTRSASGDPTNPAMERSIPVNQINKSYYVVSASFSSADKAKHQARLLMIMEYDAVVVNPESGKYYACAGMYDNYQQAQQALREYQTKKRDAWLFTP